MDPLKIIFLLKIVIFYCYVSLPEGNSICQSPLPNPFLPKKLEPVRNPMEHPMKARIFTMVNELGNPSGLAVEAMN